MKSISPTWTLRCKQTLREHLLGWAQSPWHYSGFNRALLEYHFPLISLFSSLLLLVSHPAHGSTNSSLMAHKCFGASMFHNLILVNWSPFVRAFYEINVRNLFWPNRALLSSLIPWYSTGNSLVKCLFACLFVCFVLMKLPVFSSLLTAKIAIVFSSKLRLAFTHTMF